MNIDDMSPEKQKALLYYVLSKRFDLFTRKVFNTVSPAHDYVHNWHIDAISDYLMAVESGDIRRLIINMPPRSLKSISVSIAFPAWLLGRNPATQILSASYSQKLSTSHSIDTRHVINSEWYKHTFPETRIERDQNEKTKIKTTARGHRIATSVGGSATGEGGDYLILDDPVNPKEAASEAERETANNWIGQTFFTRENNPNTSRIILVMQRLDEDDPTGHILASGQEWEHLVLPAIFEKSTTISIGNKSYHVDRGEYLHPERMGPEVLDTRRRELGEYGFAGQYMQRPAPAEGGMVKRHHFTVDENFPRSFEMVIHSWDTAIKAGAGNDYSCCTVWGIRKNGFYLIDVVNKRLEYPDLKREVLNLYNRDQPSFVLIEDKASGQQLIQDLRRESIVPIICIQPNKDKVSRFIGCTDQIEAGNVYVPSDAMWVDSYIDQLCVFPKGKHDDMVDSTSQFITWSKPRFDNLLNMQHNPFEDSQGDDYDGSRNRVSGY